MVTVYEFRTYKSFLNACFPAHGKKEISRRNLSKSIGCGPGFVSQVLSGKLDFSQEQAILIAEFLKMNAEETEFFILLLNQDRAGNLSLKKFYENKKNFILQQQKEIRSKITLDRQTPAALASEYYRSWKPTAIHMAARNPLLCTAEKIANYLGLTVKEAETTLQLLIEGGFLQSKKNRLIPTERRIHLSEHEGNLEKHHTNWRLDAVREIQHSVKKGLHYSSVMSISPEAHQKINELILKLIQSTEPIIGAAKDEQISVMQIDLYNLGK